MKSTQANNISRQSSFVHTNNYLKIGWLKFTIAILLQ